MTNVQIFEVADSKEDVSRVVL